MVLYSTQTADFSLANAGGTHRNKYPAFAPRGAFFGPASAIRNQTQPCLPAFVVWRPGAQVRASKLVSLNGVGYDEFSFCWIDRTQSNAALRRHDRRRISWGLAGRHVRFDARSFPVFYFNYSGDCGLQIWPVSRKPGALRLLPGRTNDTDYLNVRHPGSLSGMEHWPESSIGDSRW